MIRYWLLAVCGLALAGAGIAVSGWGITSVFEAGDCTTTGTIRKIESCFDGLDRHMYAIFGGTLATPVGVLLWALRGGGARRSALPLVWAVYSLVFVIVGAGMLWVARGPDASGNDVITQVGTTIGVMFIPIGLAPLAVAPLRRRLRRPAATAAGR